MNLAAVYVDAQVADWPRAQAICRRFDVPVRTVSSAQAVYAALADDPDPVGRGKRVLFLTRNKGAFIKSCPGTSHYTCCGYKILHVGTFCSMDCSYCILQAYFHPPVLQYFLNHDQMEQELGQLFATGAIHRLGTGEFTDSLIWEPWTGLSAGLIRTFAGQDRCVLELKTKTTFIDGLLDLPHRRRTILAWSLNSQPVIAAEERGTAALDARLKAAASAAGRGYPLAFHFDPIVIADGCLAEYRRTVERLFDAVAPAHIVWISLGALRFMPDLKAVIQRRFRRSKLLHGEFIAGLDGKMRYFKPLRMQLYRGIVDAIRARAPEVCVYLCMEDDEVWRHALGFTPAERGGLAGMLDAAAARRCGLAVPGGRGQR
jgi:spore photoproduct lyase